MIMISIGKNNLICFVFGMQKRKECEQPELAGSNDCSIKFESRDDGLRIGSLLCVQHVSLVFDVLVDDINECIGLSVVLEFRRDQEEPSPSCPNSQ
jgi:hypothetical protein